MVPPSVNIPDQICHLVPNTVEEQHHFCTSTIQHFYRPKMYGLVALTNTTRMLAIFPPQGWNDILAFVIYA